MRRRTHNSPQPLRILCYSLLLYAFTNSAVMASSLTTSLKMAQCRAHCLNKFTPEQSPQEDKTCKESSECYMCWQTCEKLSLNYPIWSFNCGHETRCNAGCGSACQFLSDYKDTVVPLSPYKSQLTLIFGGKSAEWNLALGPGVPSQKTVFSLFTRTSGRPWKLRLQTARNGAMLKDVVTGTQLKLVAVAESGLLSVIITPFSPSNLNRKGLDGHRTPEEEFPWNKDNVVRGDKDKGWPLLYQASVQDSGLVAAKVWWSTQRPFGSDYLVTWEVAGGGLKGHLYTDIPEVDLKLWPSTVYKVQVEVVSGPLGEPRISQLLILDTNNITAVTKSTSDEIEQVYQPQLDQQQLQQVQQEQQQQQLLAEPKVEPSVLVVHNQNVKLEIIIGATLGGALAIVIIIAFIFRSIRNSRTTFTDVSSANSKLSLNRSINDFTTDESLVIRSKKEFQDLTKEESPSCPKLHSTSKPFTNYHAPFSPVSSHNTLGIIPSSSQNIYINFPTSVPVRSNRNPRVSII